jgi:glycosyltransferase involved in cell wall biosynthesis
MSFKEDTRANVCVVGPSKKFLSGISYYTIRLSQCLSDGYGVSVLCFRNLLPKFLFPGSKHVGKDLANIGYGPNVRVYDGMDYNDPLTWLKAYGFLRKEKPDIIILQWWTSSVAHMHLLISMINSIFIGAKIFIEFHEVVDPLEESILPIKIYSRVTGRLLVRSASLYITHSESDKSLIVSKYHLPKEMVHVIPHGLYDQYDNSIQKNVARKKLGVDGEFVILSFGLIRPYKGIPNLIKAFGELPGELAKKSRLLIAGEIWEDRESVMDAIASSRYSDRITLVDSYISDDEVPLFFSSADVVVLPYLRASQSGVAHIAMSFRKPIVVSKVGGLEESMADYKGTYFVPPGDIAAIKGSIQKIYDERPGEFEPPERGWGQIAEKYREIITKALFSGKHN